MLDIKFIQQNVQEIKNAIKDKQINLDLDKLLEIANKRSKLISEIDQINKEKKQIAVSKNIEKGKELKEKSKKLELDLTKIENDYQNLMLRIPNIFDKSSPKGSEKNNKVVEKVGKPTKFDFEPKNHIQIGKDLDLIDTQTGVNVSGFRGYYLKNQAAILHLAILFYAYQKLVKKGFTPFITPTLIKEFALIGSGHFPSGKEEIYQIKNPGGSEDIYLAGTSEPSLLAYYSNKTLLEKDLPIKTCGFSQCYRSEVGSYGKDTQGIYRIHEFAKVEQVVLCKNSIEESNKILDELKENTKEILDDFNLPYQVVQIATGDMGAGKYKMYDIETWFPSRNNYGETHSDSNLTDWQARRLNIKYQTNNGSKKFVHALNNTEIASPRILIAILENFQQKDGSITIPECLHSLCGFKKIDSKK